MHVVQDDAEMTACTSVDATTCSEAAMRGRRSARSEYHVVSLHTAPHPVRVAVLHFGDPCGDPLAAVESNVVPHRVIVSGQESAAISGGPKRNGRR